MLTTERKKKEIMSKAELYTILKVATERARLVGRGVKVPVVSRIEQDDEAFNEYGSSACWIEACFEEKDKKFYYRVYYNNTLFIATSDEHFACELLLELATYIVLKHERLVCQKETVFSEMQNNARRFQFLHRYAMEFYCEDEMFLTYSFKKFLARFMII